MEKQQMREKLVELIDQARVVRTEYGVCIGGSMRIADHLIANGVTFAEANNGPTKWISVEAGELQNYIGVPVCIKRKTDGECWWAIIRGIKGDKVSTDYGGYFKLSEYGETWMVKCLPLPQQPKGE